MFTYMLYMFYFKIEEPFIKNQKPPSVLVAIIGFLKTIKYSNTVNPR